jgi:hypothetical protein
MASAAVFEIFGASTVSGRLPDARDEEPGAPPVAVLSYRTWTSLYGRDPEVLGGTLVRRLGSGNKILTIVGVLTLMPSDIATPPGTFRCGRHWTPMSFAQLTIVVERFRT